MRLRFAYRLRTMITGFDNIAHESQSTAFQSSWTDTKGKPRTCSNPSTQAIPRRSRYLGNVTLASWIRKYLGCQKG